MVRIKVGRAALLINVKERRGGGNKLIDYSDFSLENIYMSNEK